MSQFLFDYLSRRPAAQSSVKRIIDEAQVENVPAIAQLDPTGAIRVVRLDGKVLIVEEDGDTKRSQSAPVIETRRRLIADAVNEDFASEVRGLANMAAADFTERENVATAVAQDATNVREAQDNYEINMSRLFQAQLDAEAKKLGIGKRGTFKIASSKESEGEIPEEGRIFGNLAVATYGTKSNQVFRVTHIPTGFQIGNDFRTRWEATRAIVALQQTGVNLNQGALRKPTFTKADLQAMNNAVRSSSGHPEGVIPSAFRKRNAAEAGRRVQGYTSDFTGTPISTARKYGYQRTDRSASVGTAVRALVAKDSGRKVRSLAEIKAVPQPKQSVSPEAAGAKIAATLPPKLDDTAASLTPGGGATEYQAARHKATMAAVDAGTIQLDAKPGSDEYERYYRSFDVTYKGPPRALTVTAASPRTLSVADIARTQDKQTFAGRSIDAKLSNARFAPVTATTAKELATHKAWMNNPRRADILGVDRASTAIEPRPRFVKPRKPRLD